MVGLTPARVKQLHEELDCAEENFDSLTDMTALQIANDVCTFNEAFENDKPEDLVKHIQDWLDKQKAALEGRS